MTDTTTDPTGVTYRLWIAYEAAAFSDIDRAITLRGFLERIKESNDQDERLALMADAVRMLEEP